MKRLLLTFIVALTTVTGLQAQDFVWGTASWNIEDGRVYENIDEFNAEGLVLTYTNPADYYLTFLNIIAVDYNIFVDDATEPIKEVATGQGSTIIPFSYEFVEGHKYKIVTTGAILAQANLATYKTDTLSSVKDSYTISFTIKGAELVKTIDVDATMALTITDQENPLTYSLIDVNSIKTLLGIQDISEAKVYGLNLNGSFNEHHADYYDGWRDADGEYTYYWGGWDRYHGHNAYPPVYSIQITETADSIHYFFYDFWKEYDPNDPEEIGGGSVESRRAPQTSYNSILWEWDNGDGTTTTYRRSYRCDEGKDYKASFIILANKKAVQINATLHFVSQEDYQTIITNIASVKANNQTATLIYNINGTRQNGLQKGLNIVKGTDGSIRKVFVK